MDLEALLLPCSETEPSGGELDYDLDFLQLEIVARGRSEQQIGDSISAGEKPDWVTAESLALDLCTRSKDLRVALLLARAQLQNTQFVGFQAGIKLLTGYVTRYWDSVHPVPEPDDDDDTVRVSALAGLSDPAGLLTEIRQVPLALSPAGKVTLRDIQLATLRVTRGADSPEVSMADLEEIFRGIPPESLAAQSEALASCLADLTLMASTLKARGSFDYQSHIDALCDVLQEAKKETDEHIAAAPQGHTENAPIADESPAEGVAGAGEFRSRGDIIATLDRICRWYAQHEPASPVPALLQRAKRLVSQDFLALLLELAPGGADEFRNLAGLKHDAA